MKKSLFCFVSVSVFFYVSYVSHHHRDSFICLYPDLLKGKF